MLLRVIPVSDRKARSRAILVFFGLDPAPPSFRHDRPLRGADALDVLRARYSSSSRRCPGSLYLTWFGKAFCRRGETFFSTACGNERAEDYDGLVGEEECVWAVQLRLMSSKCNVVTNWV